ncbi:MAG: DUF2326 domain-containing protein [Candidatus Cloacimonetes bacterium]|nr:DUF2326 domain-containing protein [Candidatus Cloacimonadota bacterium]
MYLKSLTITRGDGTEIRNIQFHAGLNLIIDETPTTGSTETGNNVGKTTVLKLIDFCLDGSAKEVYLDQENKRNEYKVVKDFLIENKVLVVLTLKEDLFNQDSREICIERNFLSRKAKIQRIDNQDKTDKEFEAALTDILFPGHYPNKPSFRQIIAHNIRINDLSIQNTLKNLDRYTRDDEYEALYLFLFGCGFKQGSLKQELYTQINIEEKFKKRLESEQTKSAYEVSLALLESEIKALDIKKNTLRLNPNFEIDLDNLNKVKFQINQISSEIGRLRLRKELILEAKSEVQSKRSSIDLQQLKQIYQQATSLVTGIQKTFDDLYHFHNQMVESRMRFLEKDLPKIEAQTYKLNNDLNQLLAEESRLSEVITQGDSFGEIEKLIKELNDRHHQKGECESILRQINKVDKRLETLNGQLAEIDKELFSDEFALTIKNQLNKFNQHFSLVSQELYGEKYALKSDLKPSSKTGKKLYEFTAFNTNFSSGKKQGEISCFDIAYTLFADEENIPCMHFLLNDKKELMHDNQLLRIARFVNSRGIQFVASILKDKLPENLNQNNYVVIRLSQDDKLFRIENNK